MKQRSRFLHSFDILQVFELTLVSCTLNSSLWENNVEMEAECNFVRISDLTVQLKNPENGANKDWRNNWYILAAMKNDPTIDISLKI